MTSAELESTLSEVFQRENEGSADVRVGKSCGICESDGETQFRALPKGAFAEQHGIERATGEAIDPDVVDKLGGDGGLGRQIKIVNDHLSTLGILAVDKSKQNLDGGVFLSGRGGSFRSVREAAQERIVVKRDAMSESSFDGGGRNDEAIPLDRAHGRVPNDALIAEGCYVGVAAIVDEIVTTPDHPVARRFQVDLKAREFAPGSHRRDEGVEGIRRSGESDGVLLIGCEVLRIPEVEGAFTQINGLESTVAAAGFAADTERWAGEQVTDLCPVFVGLFIAIGGEFQFEGESMTRGDSFFVEFAMFRSRSQVVDANMVAEDGIHGIGEHGIVELLGGGNSLDGLIVAVVYACP